MDYVSINRFFMRNPSAQIIIPILFILLLFSPLIWMFYDMLKYQKRSMSSRRKIMYVVFCFIFTPWIVGLLYYFDKKRIRKGEPIKQIESWVSNALSGGHKESSVKNKLLSSGHHTKTYKHVFKKHKK